MNTNLDLTPDDQIKPPPRMSVEQWDKYEEDKTKKGKKK